MHIPNTLPDLLTEIYYLTHKEGGRQSWIINGYRGQFYYDGNDWDASQELIDKEICNPGEKVNVYLRTLSPQCHIEKFFVGKTFEIREGAKVVGKGRILKILRDDFQIPNFEESIISAIRDFENTAQYLIQKLIEETNQPHIELIRKGYYNEIINDDRQEVLSDNWFYDVHGEHCLFVNQTTQQELEITLADNENIKNLDPYFFYKFINTTLKYQGLSTHFYSPFQDMISLFEILENEHILGHIYNNEYRRIV